MAPRDPDLRRTWLFGPGASSDAHSAMVNSGADVLIVDLEDFTPPGRRDEARKLLAQFVNQAGKHGCMATVRINALEADGENDLAAAMPLRPDAILYPMTENIAQMHALDAALARWESIVGTTVGETEIVPVCETALGVADVRVIAKGSARIRCALLGSEDLANDLDAERTMDAAELDHARRRFLLDCRAARIEPIDAPYTFDDIEGAVREAHFGRRLGYRSKSLVRTEHAQALTEVYTPSARDLKRARGIVEAFEAARARGEERTLVDGLWIEVPAYRKAKRLIERALRLQAISRSGGDEG